MTEQKPRKSSTVGNLITRLLSRVSSVQIDQADVAVLSAVERQTENSRQGGSIWEVVRKADQATFEALLDEKPANADARGPVGECPVHMLFLYGSETHLNMARYLITNFPHTITQIYNQPEYYGENALHIAIIKRNAAMVEWLLGDPVNQQYQHEQLSAAACGNFFRVGRPCYYGESPLAFACCTNQWNIAEILMKYGASIDTVDSNGNNILHMLVIHHLPKVYTKFKERWIQVNKYAEDSIDGNEDDDRSDSDLHSHQTNIPLWKRLNKDGYTPLTLASKLGLYDMFSFLLEERKITQWSYGPVSCVLYPLDQVDLDFQRDDDSSSAALSALEIIVQNAHVELIMHPRLIDLINKKWERFARRIFFNRFLVTLLYLLIFLFTTIIDQSRIETIEGDGDDAVIVAVEPLGDFYEIIGACGRMLVLAGAIWKGRAEVNEMTAMGIKKYFQTTGSGLLENCLACAFCLSVYLVNIFRLLDWEAEIAALAMASILGWGYMLFFVMAFRLTGPFVVMIYEMLFNDVLRFFTIYAVFLAAFSQAFFILFNNNGFTGFLESVKQSFLGMLGDFDLDAYTETSYHYVSVSLLVIYVIVVTILLLNLLIAMMGDTYGNVIEGATQIWHLERARIVFAIENEMSTEERNLQSNRYWTNVDGERYLQVEEIDDQCFRCDDDDSEENQDS